MFSVFSRPLSLSYFARPSVILTLLSLLSTELQALQRLLAHYILPHARRLGVGHHQTNSLHARYADSFAVLILRRSVCALNARKSNLNISWRAYISHNMIQS